MPRITFNTPIEQRAPNLAVTNSLPVGKHVFELVVIDDAGQSSKPRRVSVTVTASNRRRVDRRDGLTDRLRVRDGLRDRIVVPPRR